MKKLYLFITALMCAVGVTNVNAQETVSLDLGCAGAKMGHGTAFGNGNNVLPTEDAVKNRLADKTTGMYWGVSQNPSDPGLNTDFRSTDNTGFTFKGRQGYSGESVAQVYEIYGTVSSLTVSFIYTSTNTNSSFSIWKVSSDEAVCLASKASNGGWVSGEKVSFSVDCTEEGKAFNLGDRLVLLWNASSTAVDVTISEFTGSMNITVDYVAKLRALVTTAQGVLANFGEEVGAYPVADASGLQTAIATARVALEAGEVAEADVTALQTAIDDIDFSTLTRNMPEPGKFYQLATWREENAGMVAFANNENKCYWKPQNATPSAVWVFEDAGEGNYYLKNLATGSYVDNYTSNAGGANTLIEKDETKTVAVEHSGDGRKVGIRVGNGMYLDRNQSSPFGVCHWDGAIEGNRMWLINEVKESGIKHTLSVGASGWATLVLGFNATIPTPDGVTVYAVESTTTTSATLKPVAGVLPANTAVLVEAPANSTVEFAYTAESASVRSLLEGTLYDKNITPAAGQTCYVLSMPADATEPGFYKAALNQESNTAFKNNANKVYLPVATDNGAPSLSFVFDTETGIEGVGAAKAGKSTIHDLSGRRVKSAQKGIYIINGKKVVK